MEQRLRLQIESELKEEMEAIQRREVFSIYHYFLKFHFRMSLKIDASTWKER